jgi:hypothetical protein
MGRLNALEQAIQQQTLQPLLQEVNAFRGTVEFFDDMIPQINQLIPSVRQAHPGADHKTVLQHAYSAAVAIRPDIQARLKASNDARAQAERRQAEEKARQQRGGAAASVHLGGQPGGSVPASQNQSVGSVAQDLAATWDEIAAR